MAIQISEYGYRIIHDDGGVFAFGDAHFAGSIPGVLQGRPLDRPITAAVEGPSQRAYAMMGGDGGVFAFGMTFQGSMAGIAGIEIVAASNDRSDGYVLLDRSGTVSWLTGTDPIQQTVPVSTDAVAVAVAGIPISVWPDTDSNYSIEQAISDRAQDTTIAYDALAFFTGNTCSDCHQAASTRAVHRWGDAWPESHHPKREGHASWSHSRRAHHTKSGQCDHSEWVSATV